VYGLSVADAWIRCGQYERVLLVGEEIQSTGMDLSTEGRHTAVIFADGAGAVVLGAQDSDDGHGILGFDLHTDGDYAEKLWVDSPGSMYHPRISEQHLREGRQWLQMDGREVFRHAVVKMPKSARAALEKLGLTFADVSLLIPHQANLRISEAIQKSLGLREDQVYNNIMTYGNTTSATIPIALDECVRSGRLKRGDLLVLTAFGSGFMGSSVRWWRGSGEAGSGGRGKGEGGRGRWAEGQIGRGALGAVGTVHPRVWPVTSANPRAVRANDVIRLTRQETDGMSYCNTSLIRGSMGLST
jgi:3-oxoacyl-[acyl-carrier-protein] synthase-3